MRRSSLPRAAVVAALALLALRAGAADAQPVAPPAGPAPAAALSATAAADSLDVARAVERFHLALADADSAAALSLLADDALILESGGRETRAEYRAHHLAADIAFARAVPRERASVHVKLQGDVAWATSTGTARGEWRGRPVHAATAELMVLTRAGAGWRIRAIHWSSRSVRPPA